MKKIFSLLLTCVSLMICLSGCLIPGQIIVENAKKEDISKHLKEYAGINNYPVTYANDETGMYRITVDQQTTVAQTETKYEYNNEHKSSSKTSAYIPEKTMTYYYIVHLVQSGNNVLLITECGDGGFNTSCSPYKALGFMKYLRNNGYYTYELKNSN